MSGSSEYVRDAENSLSYSLEADTDDGPHLAIARAQVHATLALVAAVRELREELAR